MATVELIKIPFRPTEPISRVVFTQGGKGGVGKTAFTSLLVEWYAAQNAPHILLDLDTENKARGSLAHFFPQAR
jgi:MinD-like ATPase involved in chromosome partitioning or flagellar assembly